MKHLTITITYITHDGRQPEASHVMLTEPFKIAPSIMDRIYNIPMPS